MATTKFWRAMSRLVALLAVFATAGVVSVATAQPALAACQTKGHVFAVTGGGNVYTRWETDPIDGPGLAIIVNVNYHGTLAYDLGGNGLKSGEDPFWDVYDVTGAYQFTIVGNRAGGNCVSNQKRNYLSDWEGQVFTLRATYQPGNSGVVIRNQVHVKIYFV